MLLDFVGVVPCVVHGFVTTHVVREGLHTRFVNGCFFLMVSFSMVYKDLGF